MLQMDKLIFLKRVTGVRGFAECIREIVAVSLSVDRLFYCFPFPVMPEINFAAGLDLHLTGFPNSKAAVPIPLGPSLTVKKIRGAVSCVICKLLTVPLLPVFNRVYCFLAGVRFGNKATEESFNSARLFVYKKLAGFFVYDLFPVWVAL